MVAKPWEITDREWEHLEPLLKRRTQARIPDRVCAEIVLRHYFESTPGSGRRKSRRDPRGSYDSAQWRRICEPYGVSASTVARRFREWLRTGSWTDFWLEMQQLRVDRTRTAPPSPIGLRLRRLQAVQETFQRRFFPSLPTTLISTTWFGERGDFVRGKWERNDERYDGIVIPQRLPSTKRVGLLLHHMVHQALGHVGCLDHSNRYSELAGRCGLTNDGQQAVPFATLTPQTLDLVEPLRDADPPGSSPLIQIVEWLSAIYDRLNVLCFSGDLEPVAVTFDHLRHSWATYGLEALRFGGLEYHRITISYELLRATPERLLSTLLHEMVHQRNAQLGLRDTSRKQYHNRNFRDTAQAIGLTCSYTQNWGYTHDGFSAAGARLRDDVLRDFPGDDLLGWTVRAHAGKTVAPGGALRNHCPGPS